MITKAQHTPGPWIAPSAGIWTADGECMIASLGGRDCVASRRKYARRHFGDTIESNRMEMVVHTADCNLIAASPELLSVVSEIAEQCCGCAAEDTCIHDRARAAIAKATGGK